jgi:hypothetical protein
MENGMGSGRFLAFTPCTAPGIGLFTLAIIGIPAFPAFKSFTPFGIRQEFQAFLFS